MTDQPYDSIVVELRDCTDWLETVTKQAADTGRTEALDAATVHKPVAAIRAA